MSGFVVVVVAAVLFLFQENHCGGVYSVVCMDPLQDAFIQPFILLYLCDSASGWSFTKRPTL